MLPLIHCYDLSDILFFIETVKFPLILQSMYSANTWGIAKKFEVVRHVIYVTWAGVICLICTHKPEGECGHIRQITTAHVTYVM